MDMSMILFGTTLLLFSSAQLPDTNQVYDCNSEPDVGHACINDGISQEMSDFLESLLYYYYKDGKCYPFEYMGCGGNQGNVFGTSKECYMKCKIEVVDRKRYCNLEPDVGYRCTLEGMSQESSDFLESLLYYYYDNGVCRPFEYMGCGGNENTFVDRGECYSHCSPEEKAKHKRNKDEGKSCAGGQREKMGRRFAYHPRRKKCKGFIFRGCDGNDNNFPTKEDCENVCGSKGRRRKNHRRRRRRSRGRVKKRKRGKRSNLGDLLEHQEMIEDFHIFNSYFHQYFNISKR